MRVGNGGVSGLRRWLCLPLLAGLLIAAAPAGEIMPGRWAFAADLTLDDLNGIPAFLPVPIDAPPPMCIDPGRRIDSANPAPVEGDSGCTIRRLDARGGRIALSLACPPNANGISLTMDAGGTYDATTMSLIVKARGKMEGQNANISGTMTGRRLGDCG